MRLRTIWSFPGLPLAERWDRTKEWAAIEVALRLPKRVRYWVYIQCALAVIAPDETVPDVVEGSYMDILQRLPRGER